MVLEILHWTNQERNMAGQHLERHRQQFNTSLSGSIIKLWCVICVCMSYISKSFLCQRAEGQDDSNDGHPLQNTVHSYRHAKQRHADEASQTTNTMLPWLFLWLFLTVPLTVPDVPLIVPDRSSLTSFAGTEYTSYTNFKTSPELSWPAETVMCLIHNALTCKLYLITLQPD